jgi:hypothetical protein
LEHGCTEEELLEYLRKVFSFLTIQKIIALAGVYILMPSTVVITPAVKALDKAQEYTLFFSLLVLILMLFVVHFKTTWAKSSPQLYAIYGVFVLALGSSLGLANIVNDNIEVIVLTVLVMDVTVSIYLQSNLTLGWLHGMLFNLLGTLVAFYFYYDSFQGQKWNYFLASLVGSLIYGCYLLQVVFSLLEHGQIRHNVLASLTKDDFIIGSIALYLDCGFILMVALQMIVGYMTFVILPE